MEVCESSDRIGNFVPPSSVATPTLVKLSELNDLEEVARMTRQAKLAQLLRIATVMRYKGHSARQSWTRGTTDCSDGESWTRGLPVGTILDCFPMELQMHEKHRVPKLTSVAIVPTVGETDLGTLEAHVNGFVYSTWGSRKVFLHANVEGYFFRLGNKMQKPVLQFHLRHPIMVKNKETKNIQFCLVPTPLGKVRSDKDSDNNRKDKQTRFSSSRSEDLKNFIRKVQETQLTSGSNLPRLEFQALEEFEFYTASPRGASAIFSLTYSALVVLEKNPYFVVPLQDIQIVNLAHLGPDTIDMTVVFKDLERPVLEICSIPYKFLTDIKHRLNYACVKYYVNRESLNWKEFVSDIRARPDKFIANGGWDFLEDSHTLAFYPRVNSFSDLFPECR